MRLSGVDKARRSNDLLIGPKSALLKARDQLLPRLKKQQYITGDSSFYEGLKKEEAETLMKTLTF